MIKKYLRVSGSIIFALLAIIALAATLVPMLPSKQWYVRIFDYPRLQTFAIAVLALVWYGVFYFKRGRKGYGFAAIFILVIVIQGYKAAPYTFVGHKQVLWSERGKSDTTLISFFICNVLQTNTSYDKVIEKVNRYHPDILITTESDSIWQTNLIVLEAQFPYRISVPLSNTYGMHLYSRFPLGDTRVRYLVESDIPSIKTKIKLSSGEWITLFVVHPRPPVPTESPDSRDRDAEIIMVAKEAKKEKGGIIVAGDFNDVAWSETTELFQKVSGFLDPRRGRNFYNTYHAQLPIFRWPLDHIFHNSEFKLNSIERVGDVDSDHFPMFVSLSYEPEEKHEQPAVKPDENTEKEARQTIKAQK